MGLSSRATFPTLILAVASLAAVSAQPAPRLDTIVPTDLRRHVAALTSEEMAGRGVGTIGNQLATEYVADVYQDLGLAPAGEDGTFLRQFGLVTPTLGDDNAFRVTDESGSDLGILGTDFHPERYSGSGRGVGPIVFAGFGIVAPSLDHDDYRDVDVTGRVVVVLDHEPSEYDADSRFDGVARSEHARAVRKTLEAQRHGAVGVVVVNDVHNHSGATIRESMNRTWPTSPRAPVYGLSAWTDQVRIPVVRVSGGLARRLLGLTTDQSLEDATRAAEAAGGIRPLTQPAIAVEIVTDVVKDATPQQNVVGFIEGTDPSLRNEWILVCAHLDHEGITARGVFPGADDNASGVAGLLEVAEAFATAAAAGLPPRRSVLFAAWNAEERGLLGAWAYTETPVAPLAQTVAVLNMDMIGRHEEVPERGGGRFRGLSPQTASSNENALNLLGYSYSPDLQLVAESSGRLSRTGLDLRFRYDDNASDLLRRSDHWPFLFRGVPALFIHTGLHPDYHTERDTPDLLDYDKMGRIARLVHQMTWSLANAETRPRLVSP